jgi:hypothetical protein
MELLDVPLNRMQISEQQWNATCNRALGRIDSRKKQPHPASWMETPRRKELTFRIIFYVKTLAMLERIAVIKTDYIYIYIYI